MTIANFFNSGKPTQEEFVRITNALEGRWSGDNFLTSTEFCHGGDNAESLSVNLKEGLNCFSHEPGDGPDPTWARLAEHAKVTLSRGKRQAAKPQPNRVAEACAVDPPLKPVRYYGNVVDPLNRMLPQCPSCKLDAFGITKADDDSGVPHFSRAACRRLGCPQTRKELRTALVMAAYTDELNPGRIEFYESWGLADGRTARRRRREPHDAKKGKKDFDWSPYYKGMLTGSKPKIRHSLKCKRDCDTLVYQEGDFAAAAITDAGYCAFSLAAGAKDTDKKDLSPLVGYEVIIWTDNDNDGKYGALKLDDELRAAGIETLWVDIADLPEKADAEDVSLAVIDKKLAAATTETPASILAVRDAGLKDAPPHEPFAWESPSTYLWAKTPRAAAERMMQMFARRLLVAQFDNADSQVLTTGDTGIWKPNTENAVLLWHKTVRQWLADSIAEDVDSQKLKNYAIRQDTHRAAKLSLESAGEIYKQRREDDSAIPNLIGVHHDKLDESRRYIGALNGVVDLKKFTLLTGQDAADKLITQFVPVAFNADAKDDAVDKLITSLPEPLRTYFWACVGCALWGIPHRRLILIEGSPGCGKSTHLNAITGALGGANGYASKTPERLLTERSTQSSDGPNPLLGHVITQRILTLSEPPPCEYNRDGMPLPNKSLSEATIRQISGGDEFLYRELYSNTPKYGTSSSTLFICTNEGDLDDTIKQWKKATVDRVVHFDFPDLSPNDRDYDLPAKLRTTAAKQALLAYIVKKASENRLPPKPPLELVRQVANAKAIANSRARAVRQEAYERTPAGWLRRNIVLKEGARLLPSAVLAQAKLDTENAWGLTQNQMTSLIKREFPHLIHKYANVAGETRPAFFGAHLASEGY